MYYICSAGIGYILGSISPSYILSRLKKVDIRKDGTKNLGASNTFMHFGTFWGVFVMLFDIMKAFFAVKICQLIFNEIAISGLVAGCASVLGHNYPFYLKLKGGKGLASFGGLVLAVSPLMFLMLLVLCITVAFIFNYGCVLALSAAVLFPVLTGFHFQSIAAFLIAAVCSASVFYKHTQNIKRIRAGEETKFRAFIGKYVLKLSKKKDN
ncbi:MAG: glycerol-3-phosphate acyltransferase [Clostridia bacterium]|nr:glycerol-3-phosphate acyltransferase [Clostridia bacterium]